MKRFIRSIYAPTIGRPWSNVEMHAAIRTRLASLPIEAADQQNWLDFARLLLIGTRTRYVQAANFLWLNTFADHALAFEKAIDEAVASVSTALHAESQLPRFDAIIGVCGVGQVLPGIADRVYRVIRDLARDGAILCDIGNGGCTGSSRALQMVSHLGPEIKNALIVVCEPTSTMADVQTLNRSNWQGLCTFGDGVAAAWVSAEPGGLEIQRLASWQGREDKLIRWAYGTHYYRFEISGLEDFEQEVKREIYEALHHLGCETGDNALWALHPAGIMLLLSLAKRLGLERSKLEPSIRHFRQFSNMSSASILHILKDLADLASPGQPIRWIGMGAGFHVEYGTALPV